MASILYNVIRPLLFRLDAESAHALTLTALRFTGAVPPLRWTIGRVYRAPARPVHAFGLTFRNPIGLAAGYDKDGLGWRGLACLGFGHIEIGTVTPRAQEGNPRPRLFRLPEERALINRMGFPGRGAGFVAQRLMPRTASLRAASTSSPPLVLGVNLGKNKDTPLEEAADDYLSLMRVFAPLADYLAINVSSPNTIGLRRLQAREALGELLTALAEERRQQQSRLGRGLPLLVKLAPDLSDDELDDSLDMILATGMDGAIATNTTVNRAGVRSPLARETGGLSGAPLHSRSAAMVRQIRQRTGDQLPVIGVGGIMNVADAQRMLDAGAVLVQVYTGLVYRGPGLVKDIVRGLR